MCVFGSRSSKKVGANLLLNDDYTQRYIFPRYYNIESMKIYWGSLFDAHLSNYPFDLTDLG